MIVRMCNSHLFLVGMQNGRATLEDSLAVSYKTKHTFTISSSNRATWYLPRGVENLCPQDLYTDVYSCLVIAKTWNQPSCPSVGECINKLWYNQKVEYYSALKRNELSSHEKIGRKYNCILWSEKSQYGKIHTMWFKLYDILEKAKLWRQWKYQWFLRSRREGEMNMQSTEDFRYVKLVCMIL